MALRTTSRERATRSRTVASRVICTGAPRATEAISAIERPSPDSVTGMLVSPCSVEEYSARFREFCVSFEPASPSLGHLRRNLALFRVEYDRTHRGRIAH